MLHILTSTNSENLVNELIRIVSEQPLSDPMRQEVVVVSGKGMEQWLLRKLTETLGIWTYESFPFINRIFQKWGESSSTERLTDPRFEPDSMLWQLYQILGNSAEIPELLTLQPYLNEAHQARRSLKRYQLADKLASLFDQYQAFRPEMIQAWDENSEDWQTRVMEHLAPQGAETNREFWKTTEQWQKSLWKLLSQGAEKKHRPAVFGRLAQTLENDTTFRETLPERMFLFNVFSLPPMHLLALKAMSCHCDIYLMLKMPFHATDQKIWRSDLTLHPLLSSLGQYAFQFLDLLGHSLTPQTRQITSEKKVATERQQHPDVAHKESLLTQLQIAILHPQKNPSSPLNHFSPEDDSLSVHVVHSPVREVEVLKDYLLRAFEQAAQQSILLEPEEIHIVTPQLEVYAPLLEALLNSAGSHSSEKLPWLPFFISGRHSIQRLPLVEDLFRLFDLVQSRLELSRVLDFLGSERVLRRFNLNLEELGKIRQWLSDAGVRWGNNSAHVQEMTGSDTKLPDENTWQHGIDRLLLGVVMSSPEDQPFTFSSHEILPYPHIEGNDSQILGKLLHFHEDQPFSSHEILPYPHIEGNDSQILGKLLHIHDSLFKILESLKKHPQRTFDAWNQAKKQWMDLFSLSRQEEPHALEIELTWNALAYNQKNTDSDSVEISFEVIQAWLKQTLEQKTGGSGSGKGIRVSDLKTVQGIPAKIICFLGMNDGVFPTKPAPPHFDLMALAPLETDSSVKDKDRFEFLDLLLCAQHKVFISYVGRNVINNTEQQPSTVVSELLDAVEKQFFPQGGESLQRSEQKQAVHKILVKEHRLQPFHSVYFLQSDSVSAQTLKSYSHSHFEVARKRGIPPFRERRFAEKPITDPIAAPGVVNLDALIAFWKDPCKQFLRGIGIHLSSAEEIPDTEPFAMNRLEEYLLREQLVARSLEDKDLRALFKVAKLKGSVPQGYVGDLWFAGEKRALQQFAGDIRNHQRTASREQPLGVDFPLGDWRITGTLSHLWSCGLIVYRPAKAKSKDYLSLWIQHLVLNLIPVPTHMEKRSRFVYLEKDQPKSFYFESLTTEQAQSYLICLLELYHLGRSQPLPFFPKTCMKYAELMNKKDWDATSHDSALQNAMNEWDGENQDGERTGDATDASIAYCFGDQFPESRMDQFQRIAREVFQHLLEHKITE
ncbi:MAG: exodeoxyribonuclease V subunit gamma [SAR324 cluster bacterium]|nr:exodeoxyribonuclease V subunit gamma [SAR324 cluster bacterium]